MITSECELSSFDRAKQIGTGPFGKSLKTAAVTPGRPRQTERRNTHTHAHIMHPPLQQKQEADAAHRTPRRTS